MRSILLLALCFFLNSAICFSQPKYSVSAQTIDSVVQLKKYADTYLEGAFRDLAQFSPERREYVTQILNYAVIISGKLNSLISLLDQDDLYYEWEQSENLTPEEVSKFIDYTTERIDSMEAELKKRSQSAGQALIVHHIEKVKELIQRSKLILSLIQNELKPS